MARKSALLQRILSPALAFHAPPSRQVADRIASGGLLGAGEMCRGSGEVIQALHGAALGDGRYLSPSLRVCDRHAFSDASGKRVALLCLVSLGHTERLPSALLASSSAKRQSDWHLCLCRRCEASLCDGLECRVAEARAALNAWEKECAVMRARVVRGGRDGGAGPERRNAEGITAEQRDRGERLRRKLAAIEEEHRESRFLPRRNFDSRISAEGGQWVVSRSSAVLPLLLVTYEPARPSSLPASHHWPVEQPTSPGRNAHAFGKIPAGRQTEAAWGGGSQDANQASCAVCHSLHLGEEIPEEMARRTARRAEGEAVWLAGEPKSPTPSNRLVLPRLPSLLPGQTSPWLRLTTTRPLRQPCFVRVCPDDTSVVQPSPSTALSLTPPPRALRGGDRAEARIGGSWREVQVVTVDHRAATAKVRIGGEGREGSEQSRGMRGDETLRVVRLAQIRRLAHAGATGKEASTDVSFKLTALKQCKSAVRVRFVVQGPGADELQPAGESWLAVRSDLHVISIPRDVLEACGEATQKQHLHLLLLRHHAGRPTLPHSTPSIALQPSNTSQVSYPSHPSQPSQSSHPSSLRRAVGKACCAIVRELQPSDVATLLFTDESAVSACKFTTPEAAIQSLQRADAPVSGGSGVRVGMVSGGRGVGMSVMGASQRSVQWGADAARRVGAGEGGLEAGREGRGGLGGVETAVELALSHLSRAREEQLLRADRFAEAELLRGSAPPPSAGQSAEQYVRRCLLDAVERAVELGELGEGGRQRRRRRAAERYARLLERREDHLFLVSLSPRLAREDYLAREH